VSELQGIARFKIHEGKLDDFKPLLIGSCHGARSDALLSAAREWTLFKRPISPTAEEGSDVAARPR
jgi:hypothetical protein